MSKLQKTDIQTKYLDLINQAIKKSFGSAEWFPMESLTRGLSASTLYKIQIDSDYYVVRIDNPEHPHNDLDREYHAMKMAAQHQIAPKVYYADPKNGIVIMKFIESKPLESTDLIKPNYIKKFAQLVHGLHNGADFKKDISIFERVDTIYKIMNPELKKSSVITECIEITNKLEQLLSDKEDIKPCHCDINPYNLLFDGNKFWLVDWNAASQQNFYFDLASCATFFYFYNTNVCDEFLKEYFSRDLTAIEKNRFNFMKIFVAIYYGMMFIYQSGLRNFPLLSNKEIESLPNYTEFMRLIGQGKERLDNPHTQQKFGFVFLKLALSESSSLVL
ncbi:MAG: choline/ethanolamine kinase family protein [Gammaproteobacteria bacterium]